MTSANTSLTGVCATTSLTLCSGGQDRDCGLGAATGRGAISQGRECDGDLSLARALAREVVQVGATAARRWGRVGRRAIAPSARRASAGPPAGDRDRNGPTQSAASAVVLWRTSDRV